MKKGCFAAFFLMPALAIFMVRPTQLHAQSAESLAHQETAFDLILKAPYSAVAPLFGADGERAWGGPEWDPHFVFPRPAKDISGAVFTIEHGGHKTLWITPVYDVPGHHIQHIIVIPDVMINNLDITFAESFPDATKVHVSYARTALQPVANDLVERLAAEDSARGRDWQQAIEKYLASTHKQ